MNLFLTLLFIVGYAAIAGESKLRIDKAAIALVTGVVLWVILVLGGGDRASVIAALPEHLARIAGILFFLIAAMAIVRVVELHEGFSVVTDRIRTRNPRILLWIICGITFFFSAVLDNLTTAIAMITITRHLVSETMPRRYFAGMIVIAANAGGAWSPIGDVTTTMLWIGTQITALAIIKEVFLASAVCLLVPLTITTLRLSPAIPSHVPPPPVSHVSSRRRHVAFYLGMGSFICVPIFAAVTGLPPWMGMILGAGIVWFAMEIMHRSESHDDKQKFTFAHALRGVDYPTIMFFFGILLAIGALESAHLLTALAAFMEKVFGDQRIIVVLLGLLSAIVDNVPLCAAAQSMYPLAAFPTDHFIWQFLAYCVGTGGSVLIIGSAAGVAAMGMEKIEFFWYAKTFGLLALLGYLAGAGVYVIQYGIFH